MKVDCARPGGKCEKYGCYFPGCDRGCEYHPERAVVVQDVAEGVTPPVTPTGVWNTGHLRHEFGVDAKGVKVTRVEMPEYKRDMGGDTLRDGCGPQGKMYATGRKVWDKWRVEKQTP